MRIAFVGDVHGCALHALGALVGWQTHTESSLDAVIQVGDLGAFPSEAAWAPSDHHYARDNPAQRDLFRVLAPDQDLRATLEAVLEVLGTPVLFVSGNHEDHTWLAGLHHDAEPVVPIDPVGVFHHVADGSLLELAGLRIGFLGRIEAPGYMEFDPVAYDRLQNLPQGSVDVLVTHDGPYGLATNWRGTVSGSPMVTELLERLQPRWHIGGHYHHINGPRLYGATVSYALAGLVNPRVNRFSGKSINPTARVTPGALGVLDTEGTTFSYVTEDWLADVAGTSFDLAGYLGAL
jgi:Icc-related predicted phosphoesterase